MSHDCSLCCDPVTIQTGRVILPCGHQNHVSCITKRFVNQGEEANCPVCMKWMNGKSLPYQGQALRHTPQDCSICFEAVTLSTGQVTLPCGHHNHLSCITRWFSQNDRASCPLCRDTMCGLAVPYKAEEESEAESEADEIETVIFNEVNQVRVYNWNPAESGAEPEIPVIDRRISFNKTEFLWIYQHAFYRERIWPSTLKLWDCLEGVYDTAPPTFPGDKRYYFTFKELRSLMLGDSWSVLTTDKWETLDLFMSLPDTEAYLSMSHELPIQLPVR